jgi:hypothetical protein
MWCLDFCDGNNCGMAQKIQCVSHGEREQAFVCSHLLGETAGLGFDRNEPTDNDPFPDAWCDDCELIRAAHNGWNDQSEKLVKISLPCSGCYERARIRNTRTLITLGDLADLRWRCGRCEEWHTEPCLDFSYDAPHYWSEENATENRSANLLASRSGKASKTFLDNNYCAIHDQDFFIRGIIHLPIVGSAETLRWGVWGSLSRENFETLRERHDEPDRTSLSALFSWLSNRIPEYPDTLNLKMYAHIQEAGTRPNFELEPTDHPLSKEYHRGVTPERVKEIMMQRLSQNA